MISERKGALLLGAAVIFFALETFQIRKAQEAGVFNILLFRAAGAWLIMLIISRDFWQRDQLALRILAGVLLAGCNVSWIFACLNTSVANAIGLLYSAVFLALLGDWLILRIKVRRRNAFLVLIGLAGLGVALYGGFEPFGRLGDFVALAGAVSLAVHMGCMKKLHSPRHGQDAVAVAQFCSVVLVVVVIWWVPGAISVPTGDQALRLLPIPVLAAFAFVLIGRGTNMVPPHRAGPVLMLEVPANALVAAYFLGEPLSATTIYGGLIMLAATAAISLSK